MEPIKKKEKDVNISREWVKLFLGVILAFFGMAIITYSLVVAPVGAIHASVVTTFGTILTWVGTMFGIDSNTKIKKFEIEADYELKNKELQEKMRRFDTRHGFNEENNTEMEDD